MTDEQVKSLENLSKTCKRSGILPIFLGILVMFVAIINKDTTTGAVGLFIFIVGYSYIKIASKIADSIK